MNNQFNQQFNQQPPAEEPGKTYAIISLVCGVGSLVVPWIFNAINNNILSMIISVVAIVAAILGIVFAAKARKLNMSVGLKAGGMATAGLVCSIIALALDVIGLICAAVVICSAVSLVGGAMANGGTL